LLKKKKNYYLVKVPILNVRVYRSEILSRAIFLPERCTRRRDKCNDPPPVNPSETTAGDWHPIFGLGLRAPPYTCDGVDDSAGDVERETDGYRVLQLPPPPPPLTRVCLLYRIISKSKNVLKFTYIEKYVCIVIYMLCDNCAGILISYDIGTLHIWQYYNSIDIDVIATIRFYTIDYYYDM